MTFCNITKKKCEKEYNNCMDCPIYHYKIEEKDMAKLKNGYQPEDKIPAVAVPPSTSSNVENPLAFSRETESRLMQEALNVDTPTQTKIRIIMDSMKDLLLYKNKKYGDSAINPKKIFYKGDSTNSILIRLDDKLGRVMSNTEEKPRINDVCDIIGYCTLLLISMDVTREDIEKFKD